jgi:hypothetical protein
MSKVCLASCGVCCLVCCTNDIRLGSGYVVSPTNSINIPGPPNCGTLPTVFGRRTGRRVNRQIAQLQHRHPIEGLCHACMMIQKDGDGMKCTIYYIASNLYIN